MLKNLEQLAVTIKTYEKQIRELAQTPTFKAQVERLMEIRYVGLYVATGFVAVTGGEVKGRRAMAWPSAKAGPVGRHRQTVPHHKDGVAVHETASGRECADDRPG